jgi:RNA polymerase sigma-70 factor (ECF subfamily)
VDDAQLDDETVQLTKQVQAGQIEAFEPLFDRHREYLMRLADLRLDSRVRPRVDPSDVVQETYMEAHRRFQDYVRSPPLPFRLWLRQIACDQSLKARRRHLETARRTVEREMSLPDQSSFLLARQIRGMASTPSQELQKKELTRRVREAIAGLPEHEREVVVMRHYEGLSNQEIGILLKTEPATVSKRHGRAMLRLHNVLFESDTRDSAQ